MLRLASPEVILAAGIVARLAALLLHLQLEVEPDAKEALRLAEAFRFSAPWASSLREPLWIGFVKITTAPFGYSTVALRLVTTLLSIAALFAAWSLVRRRLSPRVARLVLAMVSLNGLLVLNSARGLREELVMILVLGVVAAVFRPVPKAIVVGCLVGALSVVRWEIALLSVAMLIGAAAVRYLRATLPVMAAVGIVVLAGPWIASNGSRFGDPFVQSNQHASFWHRVYVRERLGRDAAVEHATWAGFYLDDLGPRQASTRLASGSIGLAMDVVADGAQPMGDRWLERNVGSPVLRRVGRGINRIAPIGAGLLWAVAIVGHVRRRVIWHPLLVASVAICAAGWLSYGVLRGLPYFDQRFIVFTVPFAAVILAEGLVALRSEQPSCQ